MAQRRVVVISGPTGVGENAIVEQLLKKYSNFVRLTTATTRKPRLNEQDEIDYYFFSNENFFEQIKKANIPEYQNSRDKNVYYGTYLPDLKKKLDAGLTVVVTPDITGAKYFKKNFDATTIFILPDSMENLKKRHLNRDATVSKKDLEKRLEYAKYEIENESEFYDHKVVNKQDQLDQAVEEIVEILAKDGYQLENS